MSTLFTRIIDGDLPGTFVWKDDRCAAFLSIAPLRPGHTLVVPRQEIDDWLDCPGDLRDHLLAVAAKIGRAIDAEWSPRKVALLILGLEVPHLHLHLVPIWDEATDLDFARATTVSQDDLDDAAGRIRRALAAAGEDTGI